MEVVVATIVLGGQDNRGGEDSFVHSSVCNVLDVCTMMKKKSY